MTVRLTADAHFCARVVILCVCWYSVSSALSIVNKIILQNYPVPMTLALSNLMFVPLYSSFLISFGNIRATKLTKAQHHKYLWPLAIGKAFATATGYFTLWKVPVSYASTVKASMPLFAVCLSQVILKEKQSSRVYLSLLPIVLGVIIASTTELSFSAAGLISALMSTFTYSLMNILVKKLMKETDIHPTQLLSINCQMAAVFFFPFWFFKDAVSFLNNITNGGHTSADLWMLSLMCCSGLLSFLQNLCAMSLIHQLTALSYSVCNATKRIVVITASLLTLHNPVSGANVFGMMLAVFGVFCYNRAKQLDKEDKADVLPLSRYQSFNSDGMLVRMDEDDQKSVDMLHRATSRGFSQQGSRLGDINYSDSYYGTKIDDISQQHYHNNSRRSVRQA